jgi:hypothetical protein
MSRTMNPALAPAGDRYRYAIPHFVNVKSLALDYDGYALLDRLLAMRERWIQPRSARTRAFGPPRPLAVSPRMNSGAIERPRPRKPHASGRWLFAMTRRWYRRMRGLPVV